MGGGADGGGLVDVREVCKDLSLSALVFRCRAMTELLRSPAFSSAAMLAGGSAVRALSVFLLLGFG